MKNTLLLILILFMTFGCGIGKNKTLFFTKTNVGIDVDSQPPTVDLSIARREGVIAPGFEGGGTPPVIASFSTQSGFFSRLLFGADSTFAGGDAALVLSSEHGESCDSKIKLTKVPDKDAEIPEPGQIERFFFGTDSTFGLKLFWSGSTSPYPDTIRLGFSRKELAIAPISGTPIVGDNNYKYAIGMPSFIAVLGSETETGKAEDTKHVWTQYIATGGAATALAKIDSISNSIKKRINPEMVTGSFNSKSAKKIDCLNEWLEKTGEDNVQKLDEWWKNKQYKGIGSMVIIAENNESKLIEFMKEKNITCPE